MKTIYLVILAISVYAACPNLCSGHGTCDKDGYCTCNRQPGLGLNKGSFEEYSWTGTCPKGQTFSYDDELYVASTAGNANYDTLQTTSASSRVRLLFESDGGRQAADADGETTPTEADDEKSSPPTSTPTASTASPTPVNTTSPPIITEAPVVATEAPKVEIDDIVKERPIQDSLPILKEIIGDSSTSSAPVEFVILRCYLGKNLDVYLGEITIYPEQRTNTSVLLDKFGIDDGSAIVNCNVPFTSTKVSKPSAVNPKNGVSTGNADVITSTGKVAKNEPVYVTKLGSADDDDDDSTVANKNDILTKLQDVYGTLNLTGLFDTKGRILADDGCYGLNDNKTLTYEYLCVESENPNDGAAFYRMQKVPGYVRCTVDKLELIVSQNEMDSIDGLCYFFGDVDAQLPYSEIYPWIGKSDGYYYFGRYNEKATTIIAQIDLGEGSENVEGDTKLILNLTTVPSMVKGGSEFTYNNRPIGEIQLASTKGAQMSIQLYNKEKGKFSRPIITTLESSYINTTGGDLKLEITVSPTTPIANNGTLNRDDGDDSTNEDNEGDNSATGTDSRMLWEDYQGRELDPDDDHVILLNILKVGGPHTYMECSGRGTCDRETGQCQCYNGFEGDACQRTSCPNACSNNGRCVQMHSDDTDQSFESKFFGCECDAGFRGPDCSMLECPSAEDPNGATNFDDDGEYRDCSGRGICDYTTGLCKCFSGYYGTACETQAMLQ